MEITWLNVVCSNSSHDYADQSSVGQYSGVEFNDKE
jgi:hypothetical protein